MALHRLTLRSTRHDTGSAASQRFLVGQCRAGGPAADLAKHAGELFGVPLIPWCGLCGFRWCCCVPKAMVLQGVTCKQIRS